MNRLIVLIPHYNNYEGLVKSLRSIREEISVDILVVDDGSETPPKQKDLDQIYSQGKIFLEVLDKNQGIEHALNKGLLQIEKMDYDLIGRLDCGDFNHQNRFTKQLAHLNANPEIFLLGTWAEYVDENNNFLFILKHPSKPESIAKKIFLNSMFVHPSVVFRKEIIQKIGYYPTDYPAAEDYAYFFEIVRHFKTANLPEVMLTYVVDSNSISTQKRKTQIKSRLKVILKHFKIGFYPVYGLLRNLLLLFAPRSWTTAIKRIKG